MKIEHSDSTAVTEADLHALVDGLLPAARIEAVTMWLREHPADAARVAAWQAQRAQLQGLHRGLLDEAVPTALTDALRPTWRLGWPLQMAMAASLLAVGVFSGWWLHATTGIAATASLALATPGFVQEARVAHVVYTPEQRHPVEVGVDQREHLMQWLSKRLGAKLSTPDLSALGFSLVGGRLLPGTEGQARAQFMYEATSGERVTLHVSVLAANQQSTETAFRFASDGAAQSFYWVDGRFGYALTGTQSKDKLAVLGERAYQQLTVSHSSGSKP